MKVPRLHNFNPLSLWTRTKYSNIFDDLFLQAFFLRQEILHIYFGVCCFFAIKYKCTNICDANNCNAKNFDAKNNVAKIKPQIFCGFIFATTIFVSKFLLQKIFVKQFFVYLFLQRCILRHIFLYV